MTMKSTFFTFLGFILFIISTMAIINYFVFGLLGMIIALAIITASKGWCQEFQEKVDKLFNLK